MIARRVPGFIPILFILTALTILLYLLTVYARRSTNDATIDATPRATNAVGPSEQICEGITESTDHYEDVAIDHFDITLSPGCFGAPVRFPKSWRTWYSRPIGTTKGWWVAYWRVGDSRPQGPYYSQVEPGIDMGGGFFRLEGKGRIRLYTNDVITSDDPKSNAAVAAAGDASAPQEARASALQNRISHITNEEADPHICDKPDDAYYAHYGPAAPHPAGYQDYSNPQFLFDSHHEDQIVNWTHGFTGIVPVCLIVNEHGNVEDIRLVQSPGKEMEDHIKAQFSGWRYEPGRYEDKPIRVQLAFRLKFQ